MAENPAPAGYDPYVLSAGDVKEPPATLGRAFRKIGPGMILAASIVGTGELIATTTAGAKVGFAILWLVVVSCFIKVFVQIELGRHAVSTGETTLTSFTRMPGVGRPLTWWWFFMMLTTQAQISVMIGGVGYTLHMILPGLTDGMERPALPWAVGVTVVTGLLLCFGSYRLLERTMTAMVVLFTVLTIGCVLLLPFNEEFAFGASDVASGFQFHIPADQAKILVAVAMIGITGVGASELIAYPYWCIEKGYARNVGPKDDSAAWLHRARGWLRVMKLDAWVSMIVYTVATVSFFILGAAVLHAGGAKSLGEGIGGLLGSLREMYAPILGATGAKVFIIVGAFAVLYSTLVSSTAANARSGTDFLKVNGLIHPVKGGQRFRVVQIFSALLLGLAFALFVIFPENPVLMVMIGGFAQALTLPMIAGAAIYLRYRRGDRRLTPGVVWTAFLWLSLLAFFAAAAYGVWSQINNLTK